MPHRMISIPWWSPLYALSLLAAVWFILAFVLLALWRAGFPYDLEWVEGAMVDQVRWLLEGRNLYAEPSLEYIPFPYTPLYYYLSGVLSLIFGVGLLPLRLISILSTLACFGAIYRLIQRETGQHGAGILGAGLFAASYSINAYWLDLARVDMLCMALILWAAVWVRFAKRPLDQIVAGGLLVLAVLAKQTALGFAGALLLWAILRRRNGWSWLLGSFFGFAALSLLTMYLMYGDLFFYYTVTVPARHGMIHGRLESFWQQDWLWPMGLATVLAISYFCAGNKDGSCKERLFYLILFGASLAAAFLGRIKIGGALNTLIPLHAALAIGAGLAIGMAKEQIEDSTIKWQPLHFLLLIFLFQLGMLVYNPGNFIPTEKMRRSGEESLQLLQHTPGKVWVMKSGNLTSRLHKNNVAHLSLIDDLMRDRRNAKLHKKKLLEPILSEEYSTIVGDLNALPDFCRGEVEQRYKKSEQQMSVIRWQKKDGFRIDSQKVYVRKSDSESEQANSNENNPISPLKVIQ